MNAYRPRFTVDMAMDADESGDPILIDPGFAMELIQQHQPADLNAAYRDFLLDTGVSDLEPINAARLLEWLGY